LGTQTALGTLKLFNPLIRKAAQYRSEVAVWQSAKAINKPAGALLERFDVVRLDDSKERRGVFACDVANPSWPNLTGNQIAGHHEE
jgi:hypothetical protein